MRPHPRRVKQCRAPRYIDATLIYFSWQDADFGSNHQQATRTSRKPTYFVAFRSVWASCRHVQLEIMELRTAFVGEALKVASVAPSRIADCQNRCEYFNDKQELADGTMTSDASDKKTLVKLMRPSMY